MLRSLLYDILGTYPELTPIAFPELWDFNGTLWKRPEVFNMEDRAIRDALERLLVGNDPHVNACFCFFLDGLDELLPGEEIWMLADMLSAWAKNAESKVKICISSRELPGVVDTFKSSARLRLKTSRLMMSGFTLKMVSASSTTNY